MRTSGKQLNESLKKEIEKSFSQAIADLRDVSEADKFLTDFLTVTEFESFSKRLAVAYWLKKGRSYNNIKDNIKVSTATIASVQTMMEKPGFQLAIKKMEAEEWASQWAEKITKAWPLKKQKRGG
jgi:TrpR-related protein YerC/YecD